VTAVAIVDTGSANLASVRAALVRLGADPFVTDNPEKVSSAGRVVLPGVGAFGDVMSRLRARGIADALKERVVAGRPLLAICLGMQLLAEASDETPGIPGLGLIPGTVERFAPGVSVPQLGWNRVTASTTGSFVREGYAYFANSFCLRAAGEGWTASEATYDAPFVASIERGSQLACQFHPELSGAWGAALLGRWYAC
jgi:glutamine amidotransferase